MATDLHRAVAALEQLGLAAVPFRAAVDSAVEALAEIVPEVPPAGSGVSTLNRGPDALGQLALYFLQCTREQLLGSFVGLLTDAAFDVDGVFVGNRQSLGSALLAVRAVLDPGRDTAGVSRRIVQDRAKPSPAAGQEPPSHCSVCGDQVAVGGNSPPPAARRASTLPKAGGRAMEDFLREAQEVLRAVPPRDAVRVSDLGMRQALRARVVEAIGTGLISGFALRYAEYNRCYVYRTGTEVPDSPAPAAEPGSPQAVV